MDRIVDIKITAKTIPMTDFQRLTDKLYAVMATETNHIDVQVTAVVERPTEVTFKPDTDASRKYANLLWDADFS